MWVRYFACITQLVWLVQGNAIDDPPWIGILGLPAAEGCDSMRRNEDVGAKRSSGSCFSGFYDEWVRAAGARAVGIPFDAYDTNQTALDELLQSVNGVLFTGGGVSLSPSKPYYRTAEHIFRSVQSANDAGSTFPLHGHCMGFQLLAILASGGNTSILSCGFDSEGLSVPLDWSAGADHSKFVQAMPASVYQTFTKENVTTNLHHCGVTPESFASSSSLATTMDTIATNADRAGKRFVSAIQAKNYPILGVQFHPERNVFEWTPSLNINHSAHAVAANAWMATYFVEESRKNSKRQRNLPLLRTLSTYSMSRSLVGDPLDGYTMLHFDGFSAGTVVV